MTIYMERKDWLDKQEIEAFVGTNSNYFLNNWGNYRTQKVKGINIVAFFFPMQWLGYRKLYAKAGLSYLFMFLIYLLGIVIFLVIENLPFAFYLKIYPFQ